MSHLIRLIVYLWRRIWHHCLGSLDVALPTIDRNAEAEPLKHENDVGKKNEKLPTRETKSATIELAVQATDQRSETVSQRLEISDNKLQAMEEKVDDIRILLNQVVTYRNYYQFQHLTIPSDSIYGSISTNEDPPGAEPSVIRKDEASIRPQRISIDRLLSKLAPAITMHRKPS